MDDSPQTSPLLEPFLADSSGCAVLTDVDGTLAPIVDRPEDAAVPEETSELLRELSARCGLVACVTGRRALEAREMVGVDEILYVGNHGFELLHPGDATPQLDPAAGPRGGMAGEFVAGLDQASLGDLGIRVEDKGPIQVLHWRGCDDDGAAEAEAKRIEHRARQQGLLPLWGRKVLDLRPVAGIDKGTSVHRLLTERAPFTAAMFAGDDRTDLDAFRAMKRLEGSSRLGSAVRIGVTSTESPAEIAGEADITVEGTEGVQQILRAIRG